MIKPRRIAIGLAFVIALSPILACAQSGEILSDAEATVRAIPTPTEVVDLSSTALFQIDTTAEVVGGSTGFLVPLYGSPGARFFSSQITAGETVVIQEHGLDEDGVIWYEVEGLAGSGWLTEEHLKLVE